MSILRLLLKILQDLSAEFKTIIQRLDIIKSQNVEILDELTEVKETLGLAADNISVMNQTVTDQGLLLKKIDEELQVPPPGPPVSIELTAGIPF